MKTSVAVFAPFANPHLLSVLERLEQEGLISLRLFVFRDLPRHRKELGWHTPANAYFLKPSWTSFREAVSAIRNCDEILLLGLVDPKPWMPLVAILARLIKSRCWVASEGFKTNRTRRPRFLRLFLNSPRLAFLAIGSGSCFDFVNAGFVKSKFYKFAFAESYPDAVAIVSHSQSISECDANRRIKILGVGQLSERKNFNAVLSSLMSYRGNQSVDFTLCGDGPEREKLASIAKDLPKSISLTLLGNCSGERLCKEFSSADIFVMPSKYDGWGVVLNQALQYRLPIIVSDRVRAARDHLVIDGVTGDIYRNEAELQSCLIRLIESPELRGEYSRNSASHADLWSLDSISSRFFRVLTSTEEFDDDGPLSRYETNLIST